MKPVVVQKWVEIEVGWGDRPDGYSIHLTKHDRDTFVKEYWGTMLDRQPSEYSSPEFYAPVVHDVHDDVYDEVAATKNGLRVFDNKPDWLR